jgi:ubiquinone/menaquinone biosynthesis C-methylase UbiE
MLEIARQRMPDAEIVAGDALELPFPDASFEKVFTGHFYGHLRRAKRAQFLAEARRVADGLVVADAALRPDHASEEIQERFLNDGSRHEVYKRYFDPEDLAAELGGGTVIFSGDWFVVVEAW